jgi:hypothetical protein
MFIEFVGKVFENKNRKKWKQFYNFCGKLSDTRSPWKIFWGKFCGSDKNLLRFCWIFLHGKFPQYRRESTTGQSYYGPKARKPHDSYGFLHYSK